MIFLALDNGETKKGSSALGDFLDLRQWVAEKASDKEDNYINLLSNIPPHTTELAIDAW